jgi:hypothetical protein
VKRLAERLLAQLGQARRLIRVPVKGQRPKALVRLGQGGVVASGQAKGTQRERFDVRPRRRERSFDIGRRAEDCENVEPGCGRREDEPGLTRAPSVVGEELLEQVELPTRDREYRARCLRRDAVAFELQRIGKRFELRAAFGVAS